MATTASLIPDTEYTPCAVLLKRMGIKVVALEFEHAFVTISGQHRVGNVFAVNPYTQATRDSLVRDLTASVSDDICTLIVSLLAQGLLVVITTESTAKNGDVVHHKDQCGYRYDGEEVIRRVLSYRLGEELASQIAVEPLARIMKRRLADQHILRPHEVVVVNASDAVVRKARAAHMSGILVTTGKNALFI